MPSDVKRFKIAIQPMLLYAFVAGFIGLVLGFVLVLVLNGHVAWRNVWGITKFAVPIDVVFCAAVALAMYLVSIPTGIAAEGIYGQSTFGFRRFVRWADIAKVRKLTLLNLQFVRLYSSVDGRVTTVPLFQARPQEFRAEIHKFAPPESPILNVLI